ncbi:hypothetical protein O1611_g1836 [Lasiodiplodia mahajangana]|uniref:Uncharacterized protein n=1 Tax=Lasiodiplodia mahajangana TaxID=1108764 RepID=A0ACC2JWX1_9PEZI|nr:hypothetical protein O1611_g1836 [Lasiodiplodia mahajangana]
MLVSAFLNAVPEAKMMSQTIIPIAADIATKSDIRTASKYFESGLTAPTGTFAVKKERTENDTIKICCAVDMVGDMDKYFNWHVLTKTISYKTYHL